jgi:predicted nucleic acid-binding protein
MKLPKIPEGTRVFVDANIILYTLADQSDQCRSFLARCAAGEVEGWITTIVAAEICHRRMMMEARSRGLVASNPAKELARKPATVRKLATYADEVRALLGGGLFVETVQPGDFYPALDFQHTHGLLTNDSLNLAVARRLGLHDIATADAHFDGVAGLTVHRPEDIEAL